MGGVYTNGRPTSNLEEFNLRVFLMVTHSVIGALPLGIIITSDEKTETLKEAMDLFKSSLPQNAFYGNGPTKGPCVIMTDNCAELRDAILHAWPETTHLLCIFHILQQVWRWLHEKTNCISCEHRPKLLLLFKKILYSNDEAEMDGHFSDLLCHEIAQKYPGFIKYISDVQEDRYMWALNYRKDLPTSGNNTNNLCEAQFLVIKDEILKRQKEVNIVALIDKLTNQLEDHYKNKLLWQV